MNNPILEIAMQTLAVCLPLCFAGGFAMHAGFDAWIAVKDFFWRGK
jgi:hypothetical protein